MVAPGQDRRQARPEELAKAEVRSHKVVKIGWVGECGWVGGWRGNQEVSRFKIPQHATLQEVAKAKVGWDGVGGWMGFG